MPAADALHPRSGCSASAAGIHYSPRGTPIAFTPEQPLATLSCLTNFDMHAITYSQTRCPLRGGRSPRSHPHCPHL
eukprot:295132-Chlamydomonas_euryale.AAC.3